jgi:hypothetical protein
MTNVLVMSRALHSAIVRPSLKDNLQANELRINLDLFFYDDLYFVYVSSSGTIRHRNERHGLAKQNIFAYRRFEDYEIPLVMPYK